MSLPTVGQAVWCSEVGSVTSASSNHFSSGRNVEIYRELSHRSLSLMSQAGSCYDELSCFKKGSVSDFFPTFLSPHFLRENNNVHCTFFLFSSSVFSLLLFLGIVYCSFHQAIHQININQQCLDSHNFRYCPFIGNIYKICSGPAHVPQQSLPPQAGRDLADGTAGWRANVFNKFFRLGGNDWLDLG